MYDELVKRLKESKNEQCYIGCFGNCGDCKIDAELEQAADAIEELCKRETPIRVRITTSTKRCPSCNKQVGGRGNIHGNYRFCRWCGQALDWTEPPKEE